MPGINPLNGANIGFSAMSTGRGNSDNSHAYIASRINDLYIQALSRQQGASQTSTRSLRRFIDSNSKDGQKLHKIV
ncbi:MAG: hypothetical protein Q4F80_07060 [bacterium]|nr:hypothetical protein [bacterium]